jgi:bacterioferritin
MINQDTTKWQLNDEAVQAAATNLREGAVTPSFTSARAAIVKLLNDSLATELVCVLRYRRHYFTAKGVSSAKIAEEFLAHANAELAHADRIAERIVQLGGEPDFDPDILSERSHAEYDASLGLKSMIKSNLVAERIAVETYRQMIAMLANLDPTTKHILEEILADEEEHAEELSDWYSADE